MAKKQKAADKLEATDMLPELSAEVALSYPSTIGGKDNYYDPYTPMAGPIANVTPEEPPKKGKKGAKAPVGAINDEQVAINKARKNRYDTFIGHLSENAGNMVLALSLTYGVPSEDIKSNLRAYRDDVSLGISTSSVSDLLEDVGLGKRARVAMLKRHAYSDDEKVSLVALKLATDLDGDKHDHATTYETYLRMVKGQQR
jgi:hypothetical protein